MHFVPRLLLSSVLLAATLPPTTALAASPTDDRLCHHSRDLTRAILACTRMIQDHRMSTAKRAAAYYRRGNILSINLLLADAADDFRAAIKLDPEFAVTLKNRGLAYGKTLDFERAIE